MLPGTASKQTRKRILLHLEGKILNMPMENHSCEDILYWNTQARKGDSKKSHGAYIVLQSCKVLLL